MAFAIQPPDEIKLDYKKPPNTTRQKRDTIFGTLLAESTLPENFDRVISSLETKVEKQDFTKYMITKLLEMYN